MTVVAHAVAQAKVNLGLRVLAREPTGFHALETIFHQLELADDVHVARTERERVLACTGPALPPAGLGPAAENLAWRAADAYARATGWAGGFAIELVKRIPAGGGLGGGSSDAGAVLRACDRLSETPLGAARLHDLALGLGSDVPFLAGTDAAAIGTGRGEILRAIPALPQRDVALLFPKFGVSTKAAFGWLSQARAEGAPESRGVDASPASLGPPSAFPDWSDLRGTARNDFEAVVGARHPEIDACVAALRRAGAMLAMLSGSGSTVFGVFDAAHVPAAREALQQLPGDAAVVWTRTARRVVPVQLRG